MLFFPLTDSKDYNINAPQAYNQYRRSQMATKPTKKTDKKARQRSKTSLPRIAEKDLEVPADAAKGVKAGKPKLKPPLVPIPPRNPR